MSATNRAPPAGKVDKPRPDDVLSFTLSSFAPDRRAAATANSPVMENVQLAHELLSGPGTMKNSWIYGEPNKKPAPREGVDWKYRVLHQQAVLMHADGSGFVYYPSGRAAICLSRHRSALSVLFYPDIVRSASFGTFLADGTGSLFYPPGMDGQSVPGGSPQKRPASSPAAPRSTPIPPSPVPAAPTASPARRPSPARRGRSPSPARAASTPNATTTTTTATTPAAAQTPERSVSPTRPYSPSPSNLRPQSRSGLSVDGSFASIATAGGRGKHEEGKPWLIVGKEKATLYDEFGEEVRTVRWRDGVDPALEVPIIEAEKIHVSLHATSLSDMHLIVNVEGHTLNLPLVSTRGSGPAPTSPASPNKRPRSMSATPTKMFTTLDFLEQAAARRPASAPRRVVSSPGAPEKFRSALDASFVRAKGGPAVSSPGHGPMAVVTDATLDDFLSGSERGKTYIVIGCFHGNEAQSRRIRRQLEQAVQDMRRTAQPPKFPAWMVATYDIDGNALLNERYSVRLVPCYLTFLAGRLVRAGTTLGNEGTVLSHVALHEEIVAADALASAGTFLPATYQIPFMDTSQLSSQMTALLRATKDTAHRLDRQDISNAMADRTPLPAQQALAADRARKGLRSPLPEEPEEPVAPSPAPVVATPSEPSPEAKGGRRRSGSERKPSRKV